MYTVYVQYTLFLKSVYFKCVSYFTVYRMLEHVFYLILSLSMGEEGLLTILQIMTLTLNDFSVLLLNVRIKGGTTPKIFSLCCTVFDLP